MGMSFNNGDSGSSIRTKLNAVLAAFETDSSIDQAVTWNDGATTFTAIKSNVTDTASAAGSLLMDLQAGGASKFSVRKDGVVVALGNIRVTAGNAAAPGFAYDGDTDTGMFRAAANTLGFATAGSEAMRIDSSGNLIVSGTSEGAADAITLHNAGYVWVRRTGNRAAFFDRLTSDGDIIEFRKDGAAVGSIGTIADDMFLGSNDTQLRFRDVTDAILPADSNGFLRNNAISVGQATAQIKDIHMGGTLYLDSNPVGGTEVTIADDAVASITPPRKGGCAIFSVDGDGDYPQHVYFGIIYFDVGANLNIVEVSNVAGVGGQLDVSTSDVTGTTGTDGNFTVAVQSGVLKIENRSNASRDVQVTFL